MSEPSTSTQPCPTCSGPMHWRQNRTSQSWFQGCKSWPGCNGTRDINGMSSVISPHRQNRVFAMLKAAILRSEDECLTFTEEDLQESEKYELNLEEIAEEKAYVVNLKARSTP